MAKSLVGTLPIYAQHLAEQTGVRVIVGGRIAHTDGKKVHVPFTEDDLSLSFGYVAHECSHVRNTDMEVFREAVPAPFRKNLLNALEDIRIERLSMDQYPGTEDDIRYLNRKVLLEPFKPEHLQVEAPPLHIIHNAILFGGYWKLQEPQLEEPAKGYLQALDSLLGTELADKIMAEVGDTLACNSTREVLQVVDRIIELLPSNEDQKQQPESPSDDDDEGDDEDEQSGSGDQSSDDDSKPSDSDDGSTSGKEGDQDGDGEQGATSGNQSDQGACQQDDSVNGQAGNNGNPGQSPSSDQATSDKPGDGHGGLREQALNATEDDLQGLLSDVGNAAGELLSQRAKQNPQPFDPYFLAGRPFNRSPEYSAHREQLGMQHSAGLRQILNGLLQAQVDCRVRLKRQGKRIDTSRIAMMKGGETRVFRSKARSERQSAAIQFLFDKSASMGQAMTHAEAALFAVLKSLEGLPLVTTGAMSFPGTDPIEQNCCDLIKRSSERLGGAVIAGGFGAYSAGNTPMAQAIWPAAVEVMRAKGERKILFVITDGEPNPGSEGSCKELIERCEATGIEVIGLGFGKANAYTLGRIFKKYVDVGTVENLKTALFGVVRETLTV